MTEFRVESPEARWARVGVLLQCAQAATTPDLERLIIETACAVRGHARLYHISVSWLAAHGGFVAVHRLKRLAVEGAGPIERAALGLILEEAIARGAPRELRTVLTVCLPAATAGPLFASQQDAAALRTLAERAASERSRRWGVWAPEPEDRSDVIRPATWILDQNPSFRDRIIRRGDLRCSILESLRLDAGGRAKSESEVARLAGATRPAVRKALALLVREGEVAVFRPVGNHRDNAVELRRTA